MHIQRTQNNDLIMIGHPNYATRLDHVIVSRRKLVPVRLIHFIIFIQQLAAAFGVLWLAAVALSFSL